MIDPAKLPDAFKACRVADEAFWVEQERNIQGALGQPCCTLSGISTVLMDMRGHFAVVIHGEDECAACFRHTGPAAVQFFCTGLTEPELVTGRTSAPLERCLRLVADEVAPDAIFVLGACPVEVIGDRFEVVVDKVAKDHPDIPMMALHTSGLKVGTQTAMLDWLFSSLADLPVREPIDPSWTRALRHKALHMVGASGGADVGALRDAVDAVHAMQVPAPPPPDRCVNLIGLPRVRHGVARPEHLGVLADAGLHVVANYPRDASFREWQSVGWARHGFVADRSLYPKLLGRLERRGQAIHQVPLPVGVDQSAEVYRIIGAATGTSDAVAASVAERLAAATARRDAFRARFGGLKLAYGLRMNNNYEADELAYQGLGDFFAMTELGLDITLLVQGPPDKAEKFGQMFERRGIRIPFEMFTEPWILAELLEAGRYDVSYLADHCRNEAHKAGVPMIPVRALEPWLGGAVRNLDRLEHLLRELGR